MKRILVTALSVLLVAGMAISGTVAYLTDRDGAKNTMTTGLVEIEQYEQDRNGKDFVQNQIILPIVGSAQGEKDAKGYPKAGNYVDKLVTVKNTGNTPAYVRTLIAIPNYHYIGQNESSAADNVLHWNMYDANIEENTRVEELIPGTNQYVANQWYWDKTGENAFPSSANWNTCDIEFNGREYSVYIATHKTPLAAGERTAPSMQGFYIDSKVDYNHDTGKYTYDGKDTDLTGYVDILVLSQAVQAGGFANAFAAFDEAMPLGATDEAKVATLVKWFSEAFDPNATVGGSDKLTELREATNSGKNVVLTEDVSLNTLEASIDAHGSKAAFNQKDGVFNGNGTVISVPEVGPSSSSFSVGIATSGGSIKNVTIAQAERAIYSTQLESDLILDNVTIGENVGYAFNMNTGNSLDYALIAKNCTFRGWISYGSIKSASFENCTFGHSFYYSNDVNNDSGHLVKPYVTTTFTNCNFCAGYYLDLSKLKDGCTVTFKNCSVNGVPIADNRVENYFGTVEVPDGGFTTEKIDVYRNNIIVNNG